MLNRFKDTGGSAPLSPEVTGIMQSYADFHNELQRNYDPMHRMVAKITMDRLMHGTTDDNIANVETEVRVGLEYEFSAFTAVCRGLESNLKSVKDWRISWRQFVRGEVIGHETGSNEHGIVHKLLRGPAQFEEAHGWLNGADIGYNSAIGIICPLVQVKFDPSHENGLYMPMNEMFEIEFTPPSTEN
jgi:hypothetical protein